MGKNSINFNAMNTETKNTMTVFKDSMIALAKESELHKDNMKKLNGKLEELRQNRDKAIKNGMSTDEAISKYSTLEIEKKINVENARSKSVKEPLQKAIAGWTEKGTKIAHTGCYDIIPKTMFDAYTRYISTGKRGDFLNATDEFLANIGIEVKTEKGGQSRALSELFAARIGARVASSKNMLKKGTMVSAMNKNAFNKLFLAVFCDILMDRGVIAKVEIEVVED